MRSIGKSPFRSLVLYDGALKNGFQAMPETHLSTIFAETADLFLLSGISP